MTEPGLNGYTYPFAASPDVIRSNQKDAYFQGMLLEQLSDILRNFKGARFAHTYTSEARTIAELLYLGLTTFVGNRTLGEEYCDIIQVEDDTRRLPSIYRRSGYIVTTILLPYGLNRILPAFRRRIRIKLESVLRKKSKGSSPPTSVDKFQTYILDNLDTLTSLSPFYAVSLAVFYFSGAYYHLSKRLWGLRYIFTRTVEPSSQRIGYEVLGVLLVLQISVQAYLHMHSTIVRGLTIANTIPFTGGTVVLGHGVEVSLDPQAYSSDNAPLFKTDSPAPGIEKSKLHKITQTPILQTPRYNLEDKETIVWISARQQRKCTLCLDAMKDPSVTTCGHVFCWACIGDWVREKPECPLCRQNVLAQHILPLRG